MTNTTLTNESEAMELLHRIAELHCDLDAMIGAGMEGSEPHDSAARVIATALEARDAQLKTVLNREADTIRRYDAKLDERDARIAELKGALNLAANRLDRLTVEFETGTLRFIETAEWADETRALLTKENNQ